MISIQIIIVTSWRKSYKSLNVEGREDKTKNKNIIRNKLLTFLCFFGRVIRLMKKEWNISFVDGGMSCCADVGWKVKFLGQDFALMGILVCHFLRLKCFGVQKNSFSQSLQPSLRGWRVIIVSLHHWRPFIRKKGLRVLS